MITDFSFQNNAQPAPLDVLASLRIVSVTHCDFSGQEKTGEIIMHQTLVDDVRGFFDLAYRLAFPIQSVIPIHKSPFFFDDVRSCLANNSSGFNYRYIHQTTRLSKHSFGTAFDINPVQNIYCVYDADGKETYRLPADGIYNPVVPGTLTADHELVLFLKHQGWVWGGDWTAETGRVDYQHFEKPLG